MVIVTDQNQSIVEYNYYFRKLSVATIKDSVTQLNVLENSPSQK